MKQEILNGTFDNSSIDSIIDKDLSEMFNPKINVSSETKSKIRRKAQELSPHFLVILNNYNKSKLNGNYIDDLFDLIDKFVSEFEQTLNGISDRYILSSVGLIWSKMFVTLHDEFKNTPDSLTFHYGNEKMLKIVMKKIKK